LSVDVSDISSIMSDLAAIYRYQGQCEKSEELGLHILEKRKHTLGVGHPDTLLAVSDLVIIYQCQGRYEKRKKLMMHTLEEKKRTDGVDHPDTLRVMSDLAAIYRRLGRHAESKELDCKYGSKGRTNRAVFRPGQARTDQARIELRFKDTYIRTR
jgi:hypothetical protein